MIQLNQEKLDKIVAKTVTNKNVHGAVFHIESCDKLSNNKIKIEHIFDF